MIKKSTVEDWSKVAVFSKEIWERFGVPLRYLELLKTPVIFLDRYNKMMTDLRLEYWHLNEIRARRLGLPYTDVFPQAGLPPLHSNLQEDADRDRLWRSLGWSLYLSHMAVQHLSVMVSPFVPKSEYLHLERVGNKFMNIRSELEEVFAKDLRKRGKAFEDKDIKVFYPGIDIKWEEEKS